VGSDINGDGARNDRAYVFDPSTVADTALAHGMTRLLGGAPASVRDCLTRQARTVAARNSCTGPWQGSFDLQMNYHPSLFGLDHRLTISLLSVNLLGGLDELLHGSANLRGWGLSGAPDGTLLYVRGFDPATSAYRYAVNERFGALRSGELGITAPFQLALQVHLELGPALGGFGGGAARPVAEGGGGAAESPNAADLANRYAAANPLTEILGLMDSLRLSPRQVAVLQRLSDGLDWRNTLARDTLRAIIDAAGPHPDQALLLSRLQPYLQQSQQRAREALDLAHKTLTAEQWKKLPDALKLGGGAVGPAGEAGGAAVSPSSLALVNRFAAALPNPIAEILKLKDSLRLSAGQVTFLRRVSDTLDARNAVVQDSLHVIIDRAGPRPDQTLLLSRLQPYLQQSRQHAREALDLARAALTMEQWNKLPDALKLDRRD